MKKLLILCFTTILLACTSTKNPEYTTTSINYSDKYLTAKIEYPKFKGMPNINEEIANIISVYDTEEASTLDEQIKSLSDEAKEVSEISEREVQYTSEISFNINYSKDITSVVITKYEYAGGAHPNTYSAYINANNKDIIIPNNEIINNWKALRPLVVKELCKQKEIKETDKPEESGLFINFEELPQPENIGFTKTNLILYYNRYEIAPYAFGDLLIELPLNKISEYINY